MSPSQSLQIAPGPAARLTPAQKRFNLLLRRIEQARETLAAWQDSIPLFRQAYAGAVQPLKDEVLAAHRQWLHALDALLDRDGWTRAEGNTLRELLCETAGMLLEGLGDDPELKALYDKHAVVDFDTAQREATLAMKELAESVTGLDLGEEDDLHSQDDLRARLREGMAQRDAEAEVKRAARAARRKKSAAQQQREADAQQATQSLREIYRKLASALHPDREPDAEQRAAKTALMQRVNQAYAAGDLLALLQLQLQVEQIAPAQLANAGEARLKHFNRVLDEQLAELQLEIGRIEAEWRDAHGVAESRALDPRQLQPLLEEQKRAWRAELARVQGDIRLLDDLQSTRRWLKRQRQRARSGPFDSAY